MDQSNMCRVCKREHGMAMQHTPLEYVQADNDSLKATVEELQRERDRYKAVLAGAEHEQLDKIGSQPIELCQALGQLAKQRYLDLQAALDAEREKVARLDAMYRQQLGDRDKRIDALAGSAKIWMDKLSQLKALVRALPVAIAVHVDCSIERYVRYCTSEKLNYECAFPSKKYAQAFAKLLEYRATLDATTPARKEATVREAQVGTIHDLLAECIACAGVFDVSTDYEADKADLENATQAVLDHVQTLRDERDRLRRALRIAVFLEGPENVQSEYELWCELVDNGLKEKFNEWYGERVLAALTPAGGGQDE